MRSSRSEYSRYYGDFRGVDFSSDHTLVADSRFPYLVNMYKDYAAGGGQGIETIPGFRRRFVAPNKGRVHGIHSYKDTEGTRHVLVHAGDTLYKWDNYPNNTGFAKEIVAVVKDYDEYASSIEGVGIARDYLMVEAKVSQSDFLAIVDVRSISHIDAVKGISIYPDSLDGTTNDAVYCIPNAYTFTQPDPDEISAPVRIKIPKVIKDPDGIEIARFNVGDSIKVSYFIFRADMDNTYLGNYSSSASPTRHEVGSTADGKRIIKYIYKETYTAPSSMISPVYGWGDTYYTPFDQESLPLGLSNARELIKRAAKIDPIRTKNNVVHAPFEIVSNNYYHRPQLTVLYDGTEALEDIPITECYQITATGERVYLPADAGSGIKGNRIGYRLPSDFYAEPSTMTALEFDEYKDEGKTDYNYVDIKEASGLEIHGIYTSDGSTITEYRREGDVLLFEKGIVSDGISLLIECSASDADAPEVLYKGMNERDSTSFIFGNRLYMIDGKNYLVYDGEDVSRVVDNAYVPTMYIDTIVSGDNADAGTKKEPRNILSPYFKQTFIPDGETTKYYLNETNIESIKSVKVYGEELEVGSYGLDPVNGIVTIQNPPALNDEYPAEYAGVEITAKKSIYPAIEGDGETNFDEFKSLIETATIATVFDNHVFFSGIPSKPNFILWSALKNPSYIGILNYQKDGVGTSPITAMIPVGNSLLVLKGDTEEGGAVYYHTHMETGINVMPVDYPSEQGLAGIGCLGAACNYLDDPVFVSRLGLEAIGKLNLSYERSMEHRSSLIDAKLVNLPDLASAKLCEWGGYLVLLVDGKIFLADSRQSYADHTGVMQYEWYYLEDIGVFDKQSPRYKYLSEIPPLLEGADVSINYGGKMYTPTLISEILPDVEITEVSDSNRVITSTVDINGLKVEIPTDMYELNGTYHACLCDTTGEMVGGEFKPAVVIKTIDDNLFFGTTNGDVCSFNFDKRENGTIEPKYYTFDGRAIYSGCALKMDNCGIPHLTKTTVKKSTVVKVKSFMRTAAKLRVRTNKDPFNEIARINGTRFSFNDMDFSDFSFVVGDDTLFAVREKEKKWVEKQYYLYSDEYKKPFALYYLAYRYFIAGKYKG